MSIVNKLQALKTTKSAIKQAIIDMGIDIDDSDAFASYPDKIRAISCRDVDYVETGRIITIED